MEVTELEELMQIGYDKSAVVYQKIRVVQFIVGDYKKLSSDPKRLYR